MHLVACRYRCRLLCREIASHYQAHRSNVQVLASSTIIPPILLEGSLPTKCSCTKPMNNLQQHRQHSLARNKHTATILSAVYASKTMGCAASLQYSPLQVHSRLDASFQSADASLGPASQSWQHDALGKQHMAAGAYDKHETGCCSFLQLAKHLKVNLALGNQPQSCLGQCTAGSWTGWQIIWMMLHNISTKLGTARPLANTDAEEKEKRLRDILLAHDKRCYGSEQLIQSSNQEKLPSFLPSQKCHNTPLIGCRPGGCSWTGCHVALVELLQIKNQALRPLASRCH